MDDLKQFATEYRNRVNREPETDIYAECRESLWEYEKRINPKFFKEERWHLKELADTLQAIVEERIIRIPPDRDWHITDKEEIAALQEANIEYDICKNLIIDIPPRHGKSYSLSQFEDWTFGKNPDTSIITVSPLNL